MFRSTRSHSCSYPEALGKFLIKSKSIVATAHTARRLRAALLIPSILRESASKPSYMTGQPFPKTVSLSARHRRREIAWFVVGRRRIHHGQMGSSYRNSAHYRSPTQPPHDCGQMGSCRMVYKTEKDYLMPSGNSLPRCLWTEDCRLY